MHPIAHWHPGVLWAVEMCIDRLPVSLGRKVTVNPVIELRNWLPILTMPVDRMPFEGMQPAIPGVVYRSEVRGTWHG